MVFPTVKSSVEHPLKGIVGDEVWRAVVSALPNASICISKWRDGADEPKTSVRFTNKIGENHVESIANEIGLTFTVPRINPGKRKTKVRKVITNLLGSKVADEVFSEFGGARITLKKSIEQKICKVSIFKKIVGKDAYERVYAKFARKIIFTGITCGIRVYTPDGTPEKFSLDKEQKCWPQSLQEVASIIGKDASLLLVAHFAGKKLYIPKRITGSDALSPVIGIPAACLLARELGGLFYNVPTLHNKGKKVQILDLHDDGKMSINKIAIKVGVTRRYVQMVINGK